VTRTAAQVRQEFIDFFCRKHGHAFVPSSPVVPHDDPTLLFTNAGMNQFKPYFLGTQTPKHRRVANTQKCIRAGGKHNDLDDVGHDTYHHTFFEMLGNWSFGDYFKKEAITWAWELLVDQWGLDPTRLHATYFGGDPAEQLAPDTEACDLWLEILPPERVHAGSKKDNFWEMGETGPCGPCSEIHIDLTPDKSGARLVNAGDARAIEIWNLVFIQFNRGADGKLTPLPARHVDTGMGFERVTAVLQGHNNNYATDVFVPIIQAIEKISGHTYGSDAATQRHGDATAGGTPPGGTGVSPVNRYAAFRAGDMRDEACRVIADHLRTLTFAITDGAVPDKEGRGYVLRRILRRAVRYGWQYLDLHEPFLYRLMPTINAVMGDAFPELRADPARIGRVIFEEEASFGRTLERGLALFAEAAQRAARHHGEIRGEDAFRLHDTYGFPIDLTQIMADEQGLHVDLGEYERLMEEARERARAAGKTTGMEVDQFAQQLGADLAPTDDTPKYTAETLAARVVAIVLQTEGGGAVLLTPRDHLKPGDTAAIVTDRTCFYAEAGGQVGDRGELVTAEGRFEITGTLRPGHFVLHYGTLVQGTLAAGDQVELRVDTKRRATMKNHTATHVMNWALREVLGDHVQQKGSLVDHEKTRFDFSHPQALTPAEIERVEQLVNDVIQRKLPVDYQVVPQQDALKINGLRAVFGERYPDLVRVMSVGVPVADLLARPDNPEWRQYSIEFCGGTHLKNTADIEHFAITNEEAVAKGIRRIVAVTGTSAQLTEEIGTALIQRAEQLLQGPPEEFAAGLSELQTTLVNASLALRHRARLNALLADLQKAARRQQKAEAADAADIVKQRLAEVLATAPRHGETTVVVVEMPDVPVEQLKMGADLVKQKCGSAAVLFGATERPGEGGAGVPASQSGGKVVLLAAMTPDLIKKGLKAGDLVRAIAPIVGGGGGGPPTMAQAGGKQPEKLGEALAAGAEWIKAKL